MIGDMNLEASRCVVVVGCLCVAPCGWTATEVGVDGSVVVSLNKNSSSLLYVETDVKLASETEVDEA